MDKPKFSVYRGSDGLTHGYIYATTSTSVTSRDYYLINGVLVERTLKTTLSDSTRNK